VLPLQHRLVAILAADVVGYSRLVEIDEEQAHYLLIRLRSEVVEPRITDGHERRVIKNTGDGFLAVFDSARDATQCALSLQAAVKTHAARLRARWSGRRGVAV
jgi:adenylate cyclase